jgi:hypothetical protein
MLKLIPLLLPNLFGSGHNAGKVADGSVTKPAEQNPQHTAHAIMPFCESIAIHTKASIPAEAAQNCHAMIGPTKCPMDPVNKRPAALPEMLYMRM